MSDRPMAAAEFRPLLVTPVQAAAMLGVGRTTLYYLARDGEVTAVRIGRATRFALVDLEAYVREKLNAAAHDCQAP